MSSKTQTMHNKPWFNKRTAFQIGILAATVAILVPPVTTLLSNTATLRQLHPNWLAAAFASAIAACFFAALVYMALCPKPLRLWPTVTAQLATGFTNRLLPGGLGGLGLNTFYLAKAARISKTEAATIAAANNFVGFIGFSLSLAVLGIGSSANFSHKTSPAFYWLAAAAIMVIILGVILLSNYSLGFKKKLRHFTAEIKKTLRQLLKRPKRLLLALLASLMITACYVGAFWLAVNSAGGYITPLGAILVFAVGNAALAISPTPGGIGTTELAMTAALRANSVESSLALAIVLSFRLVAYWLPIIPGYLAFRYLAAKKLI